MENNIGVGLIVGAVTASGIYVWNSKNFTKEQKILLLVCVIFPPLHWLLILIILGYNKYKSENTPQRLNENKLNSSIDNLANLKGKGILTETEYKEKVDKIESQKIEQELLNSTEYKQLKNLLESGILTKDEFEEKVIKLRKNAQVFIPPIEYTIKFVDDHHSFTHGNFKAWIISWKNGSNQKFFIKNSNGKYFIEENDKTLFFNNENEFLKYSYYNIPN